MAWVALFNQFMKCIAITPVTKPPTLSSTGLACTHSYLISQFILCNTARNNLWRRGHLTEEESAPTGGITWCYWVGASDFNRSFKLRKIPRPARSRKVWEKERPGRGRGGESRVVVWGGASLALTGGGDLTLAMLPTTAWEWRQSYSASLPTAAPSLPNCAKKKQFSTQYYIESFLALHSTRSYESQNRSNFISN